MFVMDKSRNFIHLKYLHDLFIVVTFLTLKYYILYISRAAICKIVENLTALVEK